MIIFCFGSNYFGQLGIGSRVRDNPYSPSPFGFTSDESDESIDYDDVEDVQCGSNFTIVLSKAGLLKYCGTLCGIVRPALTPVIIRLPLKCKQIACGRKHAMVLMEKGVVLSWGMGYFGQLGHGGDASYENPRIIEFLEPRKMGGCEVVSIACGGSHSGAVTNSGRTFLWGLNRSGQCGIGFKTDSIPEPTPIEVRLEANDRIKSLALSRSHSSLLTMCGRVFVWGDSSLGRLGVITSNLSSKVPKQQTFPLEIPLFKSLAAKALAAGDLHMLALVDDESNNGKGSAVYSWGYGGDGQTGHSTLLNVRTPKRIEFLDGMDVVSIGCGYSWSMAITGGGKLLTWGYGDGGWLGMRPPTDMIRVETDTPMAANLSPHIEITSFDSTHNVVIPHRVRFLSDWCVTEARGGGAHTVVFCSEKPAVATTAGDSWGSNEDADDDRKEPRSIDKQERQNRKSRNRLYDINSDSGSDIESYSELSGEKGEQQNSVSSKYDVKKDRGDDSQISKPLSSSGTDSMTARVMYLCRCQNMVELAAVLQGQGSGSDSGALVNCKEASTGNTPLIVACQSGHLDVCKLLIEHDADVNLANTKGNSPLHYCFNYGYENIGRYLIELCGANEFAINREGLTCYEGLTHSDLDEIC